MSFANQVMVFKFLELYVRGRPLSQIWSHMCMKLKLSPAIHASMLALPADQISSRYIALANLKL